MKNILILNFNTTKDIILCSHFISSLRNDYPNLNIELATFKRHENLCNIVSHVSKIHYIDNNKIATIFSNPLYSDAYAINEFMSNIQEINDTKWDQVINYSNDNISAYLINALDTNQKVGASINNSGVANCSNKWSIFQNYVLSKSSIHTIDPVTVRNHMIAVPLIRDIEKFKSNPDYSMAATQNFARIRQLKGSPGTFIVGINLAAGHDGHAPGADTLVDIIEALEDSKDYKAVLLLNGKSYQKDLVSDLNQHFGNNLISVNIDLVALPSVIGNIDAIISPANDQLLVADAMEAKCIELRGSDSPRKNPSVIYPNNYVIYENNAGSTADDCLLALNEEFGTELPVASMNSENPVYRVITDDFGHLYSQIRGSLNLNLELRYHIERSLFFQLMGYPKNTELFEHIKENTDKESLLEFVGNLKGDLTATVKTLLATLRSLKSVKHSQSNLNSFITYLDNLIMNGKQDTIVGSIVRNFEGRIENISATDTDSNIKAIETNLFRLKGELQILTSVMSDLTMVTPSITDKNIAINT